MVRAAQRPDGEAVRQRPQRPACPSSVQTGGGTPVTVHLHDDRGATRLGHDPGQGDRDRALERALTDDASGPVPDGQRDAEGGSKRVEQRAPHRRRPQPREREDPVPQSSPPPPTGQGDHPDIQMAAEHVQLLAQLRLAEGALADKHGTRLRTGHLAQDRLDLNPAAVE